MPASLPRRRSSVSPLRPLLTVALLLLGSSALAARGELPRATSPEAEGIAPEALAQLVRRAEETQSSGLVILKNGKLIGEWSFGRAPARIETMSVTKSIAVLAVLRLLGDGRIPSLDMPVHRYFPEWNQGRKKDITLYHLLAHVSGLQAARTTEEIYRSPDFVKLALAAELSEAPGTVFRYNNKAVNLLAAIVQKVSGQPLDRFLAQSVFAPLGIRDFRWTRDAAGNPHVMAGLELRPRDLAKLGQLMLDEGTWQGRRVLAAEWVRRATTPGEGPAADSGLLWWTIPAWAKVSVDAALFESWRAAGMPEALTRELGPLLGRTFPDGASYLAALGELRPDGSLREALQREVRDRGLELASVEKGPVVGFNASGYLGQYLVVLPEHRLVAVRMYAPEEGSAPAPGGRTDFADFLSLVRALPEGGPGGAPARTSDRTQRSE